MPVGPRREPAPADDAWVDAPLVVEELACRRVEPRALEVLGVARGVERLGRRWRRCGVPVGEQDVGVAGEPAAGFGEGEAEGSHGEVDCAEGAVHAHEAAAGVAPGVEGEAGVVVVVERAECLVAAHADPEPLGDSLDGEVAQTLEFFFSHDVFFV